MLIKSCNNGGTCIKLAGKLKCICKCGKDEKYNLLSLPSNDYEIASDLHTLLSLLHFQCNCSSISFLYVLMRQLVL